MTVTYFNLDNSTCDPLKYTMDRPILIVSVCMVKSTRKQRVKQYMYNRYILNYVSSVPWGEYFSKMPILVTVVGCLIHYILIHGILETYMSVVASIYGAVKLPTRQILHDWFEPLGREKWKTESGYI